MTKDKKQPEGPSPEADNRPAAAGTEAGAGSEPGAAAEKLTPEEQMALFEKDLKENDWGHQPC